MRISTPSRRLPGLLALLLSALLVTAFLGAPEVSAHHSGNPYYFSGAASACGQGVERTANPLRWGFDDTAPPAYVTAVNNAVWEWAARTNASFSAGDTLRFRFRSLGAGTGFGVQVPLDSTYIVATGHCLVTRQQIILNRSLLDTHGVPSIQNTAAHELGHARGLRHTEDVVSGGSCSPDSIMLGPKQWTWNFSCSWNMPRSFELWNINAVY